jgi:hypothetical protein
MTFSRISAVLTAAIVLFVANIASAQEAVTPASVSAEERALLEAGETVVATETGQINRGQVLGIVEAGIEPLMMIITDSDNQQLWFPDMVESALIFRETDHGRSSGRTNMPWPISDRRYEVDGRYTQYTFGGHGCHAIEYQYVPDSGNMDALFGYYLLCPWEGSDSRTIVKYVINADVGVWLPSGVIAWAQRRLMPGIITGLRARYEELH